MSNIELIDRIAPVKGSNYAIVDSNYVLGGLHTVETKSELEALHESHLREGMFGYVTAEQTYYRYDGKAWDPIVGFGDYTFPGGTPKPGGGGTVELPDYLKKEINLDLGDNNGVSLIAYHNEDHEELKTIKDALDKLLTKELQVSWTVSPSFIEYGSTVNATWSWSSNKNVNSLTIDGAARLASKTGSVTFQNINAETSKVLVINTTGGSKTLTATIKRYPNIYYGVLQSTKLPGGSTIKELNKITGKNSLNAVTSVVSGDDTSKHVYIATPDSYGTPEFVVNGFSGGFTYLGKVSISYPKLDGLSYRVYCSDEGGLGTFTITIKLSKNGN